MLGCLFQNRECYKYTKDFVWLRLLPVFVTFFTNNNDYYRLRVAKNINTTKAYPYKTNSMLRTVLLFVEYNAALIFIGRFSTRLGRQWPCPVSKKFKNRFIAKKFSKHNN